MSPAENFLGFHDAFKCGNRFRRVNAAKRFGGSHAQERARSGRQVAVHNIHQTPKRFAVCGHANFVDYQRHHQGIDMIEELEENAAPAWRATGGKLTHYAVLRNAAEILYT